MKSWIILSIVFMSALMSVLAGPASEALSAFQAGDFEKAARAYETAIQSGETSPGMYYNLAVSLQRSGRAAEAALNYRRALLLDPQMVDARVALSDYERSKGIPLAAADWRDWVVEKVPLTPFLVAGFVIFWFGAFLGLFGAFHEKRSGMVTGILLLLAGLGLFGVSYATDPRFEWRNGAVVVTAEPIPVLSAPAERSETVASLPPGSLLHLVKTNGDWAYVRLVDGKTGWLTAGSLAPLVPGT